MEAALVSASMGPMKPLPSKLTELLSEEYVKLKGVRKQIKFLRDELSTMSATLQVLGDAEVLSPPLKDWRDKVRELAYDIEDCIDNFMSCVDHVAPKGFKGFVRKLKKLTTRHAIANQIEELKARVMEVSERRLRYNLVELASNSKTFVDPRLPALYEDIDRLMGIDGPKKHIIEQLSMLTKEPTSKLKVVSIVGCGGLGKTTLANQVYHTIKNQFQYAVFVSVSRTPDMRKILRVITKGLGITGYTLDDDEQQLIDKLREHILLYSRDRYFVLIDDIWDEKAWETIKLALLDTNCGSRIIVTTRSVTVASCCSAHGGYVYQLKPLSFNDSKRLLLRRALGDEDSQNPHLEDVLVKILQKCGGLPLAIITLSSMLCDQHSKREWDRVLNAIGSALAKNPDAERMTSILSLSYFDMPHHLRTCLLYLSMFPEGYKIKKQRLINRWTAEGFIHEEQGRSAYEIGECYFNDLINRSLIQPVGVKYGQAEACRVHDIILDYIKCKAAEENFITSLDDVGQGYISEYKVCRLSVVNIDENVTISRDLVLSHVRSLTLFGHAVQTCLLPFMALRMLDLEDCSYLKDHHLANIENLFHLKYLCLGSKFITNLPEEVGELQCLETLDIQNSGIRELSSAITKLQRLSRLYVHWRTRFSDGMIGKMQNLEELQTFGVWSFKLGASMQEFTQLTKLRTLVLSLRFDCLDISEQRIQLEEDLHSYAGVLISSCSLHHLYILDYDNSPDLDSSLDFWRPAPQCMIQKLHITYCFINRVPNWISSLGNLNELKLFISCMRPEDVEILGAVPSLGFLELKSLYGADGRIVFSGEKTFRSLKYFSLSMGLCGSVIGFEKGSMPMLEYLRLVFPVHEMECLNSVSDFGLQHLSNLGNVEVEFGGKCANGSNYKRQGDIVDAVLESVESLIRSAVQKLQKRPVVIFRR